MNEIMKTNPPSRLAKKLISLSEADNWEEAKNEWKMGRYYHISEHCPKGQPSAGDRLPSQRQYRKT